MKVTLTDGTSAEIYEVGVDYEQQSAIVDAFQRADAVRSVHVKCLRPPCNGEPEHHALRICFDDDREIDIVRGMAVVVLEDRILVVPSESIQWPQAQPKRSKRERWFTRGWNGAIDAVFDTIGPDLSDYLKRQLANLRED